MPTLLINNYTGHTLYIEIPDGNKKIRVKKANWLELSNGTYEMKICARLLWFKKQYQITHVSMKRTDKILSIYLDPLLKLYLYPTQQYPLRTLGFLVIFSGLYFIIANFGNVQSSFGFLSFGAMYLILAAILFIFMVIIDCLAFFRIKSLENVFEIPNPPFP